jgi:hypothetical protein
VAVEDPAVAVVGVLVDAQVGHEDDVVADLVAQVAEGHLDDAVGVPRLGALGVLAGGDAEEDHGRDAEVAQGGHLGAEAGPGVLDDARQRRHRLGVVDALAHEEGCHEVVDRESGLGDEAAQRGGAAQAAEPALREHHAGEPTEGRSAVPQPVAQAQAAATRPSTECGSASTAR